VRHDAGRSRGQGRNCDRRRSEASVFATAKRWLRIECELRCSTTGGKKSRMPPGRIPQAANFVADVTDPRSVKSAFAEVERQLGPVYDDLCDTPCAKFEDHVPQRGSAFRLSRAQAVRLHARLRAASLACRPGRSTTRGFARFPGTLPS
jgi:hypothetical protein